MIIRETKNHESREHCLIADNRHIIRIENMIGDMIKAWPQAGSFASNNNNDNNNENNNDDNENNNNNNNNNNNDDDDDDDVDDGDDGYIDHTGTL